MKAASNKSVSVLTLRLKLSMSRIGPSILQTVLECHCRTSETSSSKKKGFSDIHSKQMFFQFCRGLERLSKQDAMRCSNGKFDDANCNNLDTWSDNLIFSQNLSSSVYYPDNESAAGFVQVRDRLAC